jgi:hypothetical protein
MTSTTGSTAVEPPSAAAPRRRLGPPGLLFYAAVIAAILLAIDASTRRSLWLLALGLPIWVGLAGVWFVRLVMALRDTRGRISVAHWVRWLAIPMALGLVFVMTSTRTDALVQARFDLSRSALDSMAREFEAGGSLARGWVGLYDVGAVEPTANGFWFVIDDSGLGRWGLAYAPDGEPKESDDNYSPLWTGARFEHVDGPWWTFAQSWD